MAFFHCHEPRCGRQNRARNLSDLHVLGDVEEFVRQLGPSWHRPDMCDGNDNFAAVDFVGI